MKITSYTEYLMRGKFSDIKTRGMLYDGLRPEISTLWLVLSECRRQALHQPNKDDVKQNISYVEYLTKLRIIKVGVV